MTPARIRDDRLSWLCLKDRLQRLVHRRRMWDTLLTLGLAPGLTREWEQRRMSRFALAVDRVARRLSEPERLALRETRRLPDWFAPAVRAEYRRVGP